MSFLYCILKPIVRKLVKTRVNQNLSYESFVQTSHKMQEKFVFKLPTKHGYEFHDENIGGFHCIVGHKIGMDTKRALTYFVGGGERRWQIPSTKSIISYINNTKRDIWIPLYPLYPDYNVLDEVNMLCEVHQKMLEKYAAKDIAWLGFSAGADLIMATGRHIIQLGNPLPMPELMIPVSCCNLVLSDESYARMEEIEKRDIMMSASVMKAFPEYYNPDHKYPKYLWGCAAEDNYSGFPKIVMFFGGDEIFAAEAEEYEKAFRRCKVKDYTIHVEPGMFHAYPMFTFLKEGKKGESDLMEYLKA